MKFKIAAFIALVCINKINFTSESEQATKEILAHLALIKEDQIKLAAFFRQGVSPNNLMFVHQGLMFLDIAQELGNENLVNFLRENGALTFEEFKKNNPDIIRQK